MSDSEKMLTNTYEYIYKMQWKNYDTCLDRECIR